MTDRYPTFRHLAFERADPAPSTAAVVDLERELGAALPQAFREFLAVANGGHLEYVVDVVLPDGSVEEMGFGSFFCLGDTGTSERFVDELRRSRESIKTPPGVLPIARDAGGSMLFLDLSHEGRGRVVAFVEGMPAWTGRRTESSYVEVAESFDAYIAKLRIDRAALLDALENEATELSHLAATEEWLDIGMPAWRDDPVVFEAVSSARRCLTSAV